MNPREVRVITKAAVEAVKKTKATPAVEAQEEESFPALWVDNITIAGTPRAILLYKGRVAIRTFETIRDLGSEIE